MKGFKLSGKLSLVWILALTAILYTGYVLITKAEENKKTAIEVFGQEGSLPDTNDSLLDLLR